MIRVRVRSKGNQLPEAASPAAQEQLPQTLMGRLKDFVCMSDT